MVAYRFLNHLILAMHCRPCLMPWPLTTRTELSRNTSLPVGKTVIDYIIIILHEMMGNCNHVIVPGPEKPHDTYNQSALGVGSQVAS